MPPINSKPVVNRKVIKHKAFVKDITEWSLTVSITNQSACASCHANGACSMADVREKEVEITNFHGNYVPGQEVSVIFHESLGFKALFYGYILPFLLVLFLLIFIYSVTDNEVIAGLSGLGILFPYYMMLYFFRSVLKKVFSFELEEEDRL